MASPEFSGFSVSQHDWSLHRQGEVDRARHQKKVEESIRQNLGNIVSSGDIIVPDPKDGHIIKVPIRGLEEYHFRFDPNAENKQDVGQGNGDSKVGDVIGRIPRKGQGREGGRESGEDVYELEMSYKNFEKIAFEGWHLPFMRDVQQKVVESETVRFTDIRKSGAFSNLDKRRTIRENLKRNAMAGDPRFKNLRNEDLRFRTYETEIERRSNAVIMAMMDVSSSMGEKERRAAKTFFNITRRFLNTQYADVEQVYLIHHTTAKEVDEVDFFRRAESGGTLISSAYTLANEIIDKRYNPDEWNIYLFHVTDGDNASTDKDEALKEYRKAHERANLFGYIQYDPQNNGSLPNPYKFLDVLERAPGNKLITTSMHDPAEAYDAAKYIFTLDEDQGKVA